MILWTEKDERSTAYQTVLRVLLEQRIGRLGDAHPIVVACSHLSSHLHALLPHTFPGYTRRRSSSQIFAEFLVLPRGSMSAKHVISRESKEENERWSR